MPEAGDDLSARLDVWLWRTRFFKTRSLAMTAIKRRAVRISRAGETRRTNKPGTSILPGDVVTFRKAKHIHTVEVLAPGERRGPASEAQLLYRAVGEDDV